jgi:hypothetical protein
VEDHLRDLAAREKTVGEGVAALHEHYLHQGLIFIVDDGTQRPATPAELGITA